MGCLLFGCLRFSCVKYCVIDLVLLFLGLVCGFALVGLLVFRCW